MNWTGRDSLPRLTVITTPVRRQWGKNEQVVLNIERRATSKQPPSFWFYTYFSRSMMLWLIVGPTRTGTILTVVWGLGEIFLRQVCLSPVNMGSLHTHTPLDYPYFLCYFPWIERMWVHLLSLSVTLPFFNRKLERGSTINVSYGIRSHPIPFHHSTAIM